MDFKSWVTWISLEPVGHEVPARHQSGNVQLACEYKAWSSEINRGKLQRAMGRKSQRGRAGSWRPEESVSHALTAEKSWKIRKNPNILDEGGKGRIGRQLPALARAVSIGSQV